VAELVRADAESVREVETFLAGELAEPVALPGVWLAVGPYGRTLARLSRASAVTLGNVIHLSPAAVEVLGAAGPDGLRPGQALATLGALFVHECTHVWQYRRQTAARFLRSYLLSYYNNISLLSAFSRSARHAAYLSIPLEEEAYRMGEAWARRGALDTAPAVGRTVDPER
jgi:hypothetical protein